MCGIETDALSNPLNATQRSFVKKLRRENNFAFQQLDCGWRHHSPHAMDMPKYTPIICGDANQNTNINFDLERNNVQLNQQAMATKTASGNLFQIPCEAAGPGQ